MIAKNLRKIEVAYGHRLLFSSAIIEALTFNNFIVNVPAVKMQSWNFDSESFAHTYVATSITRIGECKLGVTILDPKFRAQKYAEKYGYSISIYRSIRAKNPYVIEADIANEMTNFRVTKNTEGDSIEWHKIAPEKMFSIILGHIKSNL